MGYDFGPLGLVLNALKVIKRFTGGPITFDRVIEMSAVVLPIGRINK